MRRRHRSIKHIRNIVKLILIRDEATRSSDDILYVEVIRILCPNLLTESLEVAFRNKDLPCYESVRRARQWIQNKFPELCGSEEVEAFRVVNEEEYRDFARSVT